MMDNIFETIFILALDAEDGEMIRPVRKTIETVIAAAILTELVLRKRIGLTDNRVVVTDPLPTEHPLLNKALVDILDTNRSRKLKYWINTLIYKKYLEETGHYLVVKGILTRKKKQLKLVIPYREAGYGQGSAKSARSRAYLPGA